jgi:hypothetical protein
LNCYRTVVEETGDALALGPCPGRLRVFAFEGLSRVPVRRVTAPVRRPLQARQPRAPGSLIPDHPGFVASSLNQLEGTT